jgi:transposase
MLVPPRSQSFAAYIVDFNFYCTNVGAGVGKMGSVDPAASDRRASDPLIEACQSRTRVRNRLQEGVERQFRKVVMHELAFSGGAWRLLPKDFPPFSTVYKYFYRRRYDGLLRTINNERERDEQPTAFGIDGIAIALSFRTSALPALA